MRFDAHIDDALLDQAMRLLGTRSQRETVEAALQHVLRDEALIAKLRERQAEAVLALEGSMPDWNDGRFDEGEDPDAW